MPLSPTQQVLNGPIPGESLTQAPGSRPYEQPPQYTTIDDAMNSILKSLQDKKNTHHLLALLEAGVPMNVIVGTLLQHGFAEGKWAPSMTFLLMAPLSMLLVRIAKEAGIKYIPSYNGKRDPGLDDLYSIIEKKKAKEKVSTVANKKFEQVLKTAKVSPDTAAQLSPASNMNKSSGGFMSAPGATSNPPAPSGPGPQGTVNPMQSNFNAMQPNFSPLGGNG